MKLSLANGFYLSLISVVILAITGRRIQIFLQEEQKIFYLCLVILSLLLAFLLYKFKNHLTLNVKGVLVIAITIITFSFFATSKEEWVHFFEYAAITFLGTLSFPQKFTYLSCFLFILFVGIVDESVQSITPQRVFDLRDIMLNLIGGFAGVMLAKTAFKNPK